MGISALVPFRDWIVGARCRHASFSAAESPVRRGARLRCYVCRVCDRRHPWRIRARCAATHRGDIVNAGRLDDLAQAVALPAHGGLQPDCSGRHAFYPNLVGLAAA